ncbi:hypothetical protein [Streptomyces meridianus]|uniref:DUF2771 domain-containing protein n=1 Tax=Streptomyces meridianus TaxID=2938945 RepID=A0ABT0X3Q5_9ACTN|nr:hypothetical protein [Streptomyces meridianus]MCM2576860.1 hypothetical protein [Streptomyces meridianus]
MTTATRRSRTSTPSRGKARRTVAVLGAVSFGLVALAACDKPTPLTTVTVGSDTITTGAACYNDGKPLSTKILQSCLGAKPDKKISVGPGGKVRIGVEPEVADNGWALVVNGQGLMNEASHDTYRSFSHDELFPVQQSQQGAAPPAKTAQVALIEVGKSNKPKGAWQFVVDRKS